MRFRNHSDFHNLARDGIRNLCVVHGESVYHTSDQRDRTQLLSCDRTTYETILRGEAQYKVCDYMNLQLAQVCDHGIVDRSFLFVNQIMHP